MGIPSKRRRISKASHPPQMAGVDTEREVISILRRTGGMAFRIWGYRVMISLSPVNLLDAVDIMTGVGLLQTVGVDWGLNADGLVGDALVGIPQQPIIDWAWSRKRVLVATGGPMLEETLMGTEWVNTDLIVPEVFLYAAYQTIGQVAGSDPTIRVVMEYEPIKVSVGEQGAIRSAWGGDFKD